jgi:Holliday junction resolvase RusA-like endonuclease
VEARPTFNGRGKNAYYAAVKAAAAAVIDRPITTSDIELEIIYSTALNPAQRLDADNVNKPTLDALKGVAYLDDAQVRHVDSTLFDRTGGQVTGRVEHIQRLFYTAQPHVLLISIYSDTRLAELGGESVVTHRRYIEFEREYEARLRQGALDAAAAALAERDEFVESAGVYREPSSGWYVCPRCRAEKKRSLLVKGERGFTCPVCTGYFRDGARREPESPPYRGPNSWMS